MKLVDTSKVCSSIEDRPSEQHHQKQKVIPHTVRKSGQYFLPQRSPEVHEYARILPEITVGGGWARWEIITKGGTCNEHWVLNISVELLNATPEINIALYVNDNLNKNVEKLKTNKNSKTQKPKTIIGAEEVTSP